VHALLRRKPKRDPLRSNPKLEIGNRLDNGGDGSNGLTPTEFRLASCLLSNRGRLLDYPRLIGEVWGGKEVGLGTLHFYVHQLRRKLQGYFPCRIVNCWGVGYHLEGKVIK